MTILQGLAINVLMLAVTVGVLYWAAERGPDSESAQAVALLSQAGSAPPESGKPVSVGAASVSSSRSGRPVRFPLDLNSARMEDLAELPGIGEKLAERLVEYRRSHGGFRSVEDLRKVQGVGEKRMERLRPLVRTGEAP
jgi:competence ComEA-like helix-hairpin-helix protein